jgi:Tfp pilus assembly protein PilF
MRFSAPPGDELLGNRLLGAFRATDASHRYMVAETEELKIAKRRLILRDSISFASLLFGTAVLFAATLFLFRSFTARRVVLAQYWSTAGERDLQAGKPNDAITDLRTALAYSPGTRAYQLLLAQALGQADCSGCRDESFNYYMSLWEAEPGDGPINLALARLAAERNDRPAAVNFYRASIYGTWEGHGVDRRADVRLELARYLIAGNQLDAARLELLTASSNAPDNFDRDMALGEMLQQTNDPADAWTAYQKAIADRPADTAALDAAGNLAYRSGDFDDAERMFTRAIATADTGHAASPAASDRVAPDDRTLAQNAARILELAPSSAQTPQQRVQRILAARAIAKRRFDLCSAQYSAEKPLPAPLDALDARWIGIPGTLTSTVLLRDPAQQAATMHLVFDTEIDTARVCTAATGDDALLLTLSTSSHNLLATAERPAQTLVPLD